MKRTLIFTVVLAMVVVLSGGFSFANGEGNGGGGDKLTIKDNNVILGHGNTGIQGNKNHHNVVIGGDVSVGTNAGGSIKNTNKNTNTNTNKNKNVNVNKNDNTNVNVNKNKNVNVNKNDNKNTNKNKNTNNVKNDIKIEGDTYEAAKMHITGPELMKSDAKFAHGKKFSGRTKGSVWEKVDMLTLSQAKRLASKSSDAKVEDSLLFEMKYRTSSINKGVPTGDTVKYMGSILVYPKGTDVTAGGMEGKAAKYLMDKGATHMHRVYFGSGDRADGDSWNIGIGGGASIVTSGDALAIAPNGGMGFGGADATNDNLPEMVFEVYSDEGILDLTKQSKKQTGNYTQFGTQASNR